MIGSKETLSTMFTFLFYELSRNQEIQNNLRNEIKNALDKSGGKISYELLESELPFLNQVLDETLRMYTVISHIDRICAEPYSLEPYSDFKIPSGVPVLVPIFSLCHDEKFFEDPWTFKPERFADGVKFPFASMLSFGGGPRNCIGERFAMMIMKLTTVKLLKDFRVEMNAKTPRELKFKKHSSILRPEMEIFVDFVKDKI